MNMRPGSCLCTVVGVASAIALAARTNATAHPMPVKPNIPPATSIDLWPEGVPGPVVDVGPEKIVDGRAVNVTIPTLTVFAPAAGTSNGLAGIVCPGGGYVRLAVDKEGSEITRWLNSLGVTAFVLKYRVAPQRHPAPLRDVLRAVRLVRSRAAEWGIDPKRIGVFGSSAGGHLAASAATLFDSPEGKTAAALDAVSARPDFVVLQYPVITMKGPAAHGGSRDALLGAGASAALLDRLSLQQQVTAATPPAFILHTAEDKSVPAENSLLFYQALRAAGVSAEMHLYEKGPHGFGIKPGLGPTSDWPKRAEEWMRAHGWLPY
jgi:acetyl esterase/lipase